MKNVLLFIVGSGFLSAGVQISAQELLATTNQGELVEIDLAAGTATLIGDAGIFNGKDMGWTDLALDAAGNLYAVSRVRSELPSEPPCPTAGGGAGRCTHLYRLDPNTGMVGQEVGDLQAAFVSDVDFALDGTLYGNQWDLRGSLITVNPVTATANKVGPFGNGFNNGGLSVHPITGEIWAVERFSSRISRVDPSTGAAIPPIVNLGLLDTPIGFGMDALEILPNGRFIATRSRDSSDIYEINPIPDAISGLAEITLIPLVLDAGITGSLNGLESLQTPSDLLESLLSDVMNLNLSKGIANSIDAKINTALQALDDMNQNNDVAAFNAMQAFINVVNAQRGNQISEEDADALIAAAQVIIDQLNP